MRSLAGTSKLLHLTLRRDRIRLPVWLLSLTLLVAGFAAAYRDVLKSPQDLIAVTQLYLTNPSARLFGLPSGLDLGSYAMLRAGLFIGIIVALLNIFLVIRHTRQNEETGREELLRSGKVGRHASLAAAVTVALGVNACIAALTAFMLIANQFDVQGAIAAGAMWGAVGMSFAAIAAVTAQLTKTTRGASGLAGAGLGAAFVLSAVGGLLGTVDAVAYRVVPAWPTWFTPLGWAQLMRPFSENNWLWLAVFAAFIIVCIAAAVVLNARRDTGMGLLPEHRGPDRAAKNLLSPMGLIWRLQRGSFTGWFFGVVVIGAGMGSLSQSVSSSLSQSEDIKMFVTRLGGTDQLIAAFLGLIISMIGAIVAAFTVQSILRVHADEDGGTAEAVLATRISRQRWLGSYIAYGALATAAIIVCLGAAEGLTTGLTLGNTGHYISELLAAALVQLPAMFVFGGIAVLCFGLVPRAAVAITWAAYALAMLAGPIMSGLIRVPHWAQNVSPFSHTPNAPAEPITAMPLIVLSLIAVGLTAAGLSFYRRRNVAGAG